MINKYVIFSDEDCLQHAILMHSGGDITNAEKKWNAAPAETHKRFLSASKEMLEVIKITGPVDTEKTRRISINDLIEVSPGSRNAN